MNKTSHSFEISPKKHLLYINFREYWRYRDLLFLLVKRDFVAAYKQTVLGPLWFFIQPIISSIIYSVVFNRVAKISTNEVPPYLFYLGSLTMWSFFSACFTSSSNLFTGGAALFGKVYFPRLIVPLAAIINNMIRFGMQFLLFIATYLYYMYYSTSNVALDISIYILLLPVLIILVSGIGLGLGIIVSSLTTKYRDLTNLVGFGIQLLLYASPVIYPVSQIPEDIPYLKEILALNPLTSILESFRLAFFETGSTMHWGGLLYTFVFMVVVFIIGLIAFNRTEKNFIDTV